jgi:hypothetical protein
MMHFRNSHPHFEPERHLHWRAPAGVRSQRAYGQRLWLEDEWLNLFRSRLDLGLIFDPTDAKE